MINAIIERCAGLDVHQETIAACVLSGPLDRSPHCETRTFGTMTQDLLALADWLTQMGCSHVAMESTGVYWKPVWNILESFNFQLILANAYHIKNLPGRKTDMSDSEWITKLLRCGLIESSFVPPVEIRQLRDLTRYRKKLVHDATSEKNRIHKVLQDANIKLASHMSDLFGVSGHLLLQKMIDGEVITMDFLTTSMKGELRHKSFKLLQSLNGRLHSHHRDMLRMSWQHLLFIEESIANIESQIDSCLAQNQTAVELLSSVPGINPHAASVILAEIGTDMSQFHSEHHLAAWSGLAPGNHESAGKKKDHALGTVTPI